MRLWFAAILLAALGLVMGGAHLLELPVRAGYDAEFYMQVTSTLYHYFALVGGPVQVAALGLAAMLAWKNRGRPGRQHALAGATLLATSLVAWALMVQPVNNAWGAATAADPHTAVQAYDALRTRWEAGHVVAFTAWLAGFVVLLTGGLRAGSAHAASTGHGRADPRRLR
jgi:hypothetical protein